MSTAVNQLSPPEWDRVQRRVLIAAGAGFLVCLVGLLLDRGQFFRSYLVAFLFVLGLSLGGLAIVMLQHLTGGAWGLVIRRVLESAMRTLPLVALLFVPVAIGVPWLYEWAQPDWAEAYRAEHGSQHLAFDKTDYLRPGFFCVRAVIYFAIWLGMVLIHTRWSRRQDRTADPHLPGVFRSFSAPGLIVYALTITLASIDWVMSLQPDWYSTIYSALFAVGQVLNSLAFAIAALVLLATQPPLKAVVAPKHLRDLGNLMLAFTMLWAYMAFSQFLLIWSANLTEEIPFYLRRAQGGWEYVAGSLAFFGFVVPFLLLLSRDVKRNPRFLAMVAGLVMLMRFVDLFWQVTPAVLTPALREQKHAVADLDWRWLWLDAAALIAVGGAWLAWFLGQLKRMPLLPVGDPFLPEVTTHHE